MRKPTTLAAAITVSAMFALMGLAGSALADKEDPVPKQHKEDVKHQFVNLALIGDIITVCTDLTVSVNVTVSDGSRDGSQTVVPTTPVDIPGVNQENFCLGGAIAPYDPADSRSNWDIWIHDYVWNGCDDYTIPAQDGLCPEQPEMGWGVEGVAEQLLETATDPLGTDPVNWKVELKSAGLARTETTYDLPEIVKQPGDDELQCTPIPPNTSPTSGPRICEQEVGSQSASRITNQFGFCGQGSINAASGMVDPFDISTGPSNAQASNVTVTKVVFADAIVFFALDCSLVDGVTGALEGPYNMVADLVNSLTCPDPVLGITIVCLNDLPAVGSGCFVDKTQNPPPKRINLGVPSLIGEIGWTHLPTDTCKDEPTHGDWVYFGPGTDLVFKDLVEDPGDPTDGIEPVLCISAVLLKAGAALTAVSCPPATCSINGPAFGTTDPAFAFKQNVNCVNEDACDGKNVNVFAHVVPHASLLGDFASADVYCEDVLIVGVTATVAANKAGATAMAGPVPKHIPGDYECDMNFGAVPGYNPYIAIAKCFDDPA